MADQGYKDDTTIMAWDVANEPVLQWFDRATIHNWLSQATAYIKSIDPNHLVTLGTAGWAGDIFDQDKAYYEALDVTGLDFFSFHMYPPRRVLAARAR
jgi:mannan endo-1,4-beta-mannosidase